MNITILCTDPIHPINPFITDWAEKLRPHHEIEILRRTSQCQGGDILFLVSCSEIVPPATRSLYRHSVVLHASDLPEGKGWSPHIWDVIEHRNILTISLLDAADPVDSGPIWKKVRINIDSTDLHDEINARLFDAELELMTWMVNHGDHSVPVIQSGKSTFRRRRTPEDSRIDPARTIAEQFDLLRVCDPTRFPPFFDLRGERYLIHITKAETKQ